MEEKEISHAEIPEENHDLQVVDESQTSQKRAPLNNDFKSEVTHRSFDFKCEECGEEIEKGLCGKHRVETGHRTFQAISRREDDFNR